MGGRGANSSIKAGRTSIEDFTSQTDKDYFNAKYVKEQQNWENGLTSEERDALGNYTSYGYDIINKSLYHGGNSWENHSQSKEISNISSALDKFKLKENIRVIRTQDAKLFGGETDPSKLQEYVGGTITNNAFWSTSASDHAILGTGKPLIMKINVKKGTGRGAYVGNISFYGSEKEFLINKNQNWNIDKIYRDNNLGKTIVELSLKK